MCVCVCERDVSVLVKYFMDYVLQSDKKFVANIFPIVAHLWHTHSKPLHWREQPKNVLRRP